MLVKKSEIPTNIQYQLNQKQNQYKGEVTRISYVQILHENRKSNHN